MDRHADGAPLVGDGAGDGLPNPPRGVGAELEAASVVELLDCLHQAQVTLLDQVQERHALAHVALGHADDQPRVGLDEVLAGQLTLAHLALGTVVLHARAAVASQPPPRDTPAFQALRQFDFLLGGEQRNVADLLQVEANRIIRVNPAEVKGVVNLHDSNRLVLKDRIVGDLLIVLRITVADDDTLADEEVVHIVDVGYVTLALGEESQNLVERHEPSLAGLHQQLLESGGVLSWGAVGQSSHRSRCLHLDESRSRDS